MSEGRSRGDLKWKRKRTMEAKLKAMREAKMAKLAVSREEPGSLGSTSSGAGAAEPLPGPYRASSQRTNYHLHWRI